MIGWAINMFYTPNLLTAPGDVDDNYIVDYYKVVGDQWTI